MIQSEMAGMSEEGMEEGKLPFFGASEVKQKKRAAKCTLELASKLQVNQMVPSLSSPLIIVVITPNARMVPSLSSPHPMRE
jgi:hypothetical protein